MTTLKIIDIIGSKNAVTHSFGLKVFEVVSQYLAKNEKVCLSFLEVKNITSGFCNASVGKLYLEFPKNASTLLTFSGISKEIWKEKIDSSINLASSSQLLSINDTAINELFQ